MKEIQTVDGRLRPECVGCPAAALVKGNRAIHCRVEGVVLNADGENSDKTSIEHFCAGDYTTCPSWRQHKKTGLTQAEHAAVTKHREYLAELADNDLLDEFEERAGRY
jgi:hypothetical protein